MIPQKSPRFAQWAETLAPAVQANIESVLKAGSPSITRDAFEAGLVAGIVLQPSVFALPTDSAADVWAEEARLAFLTKTRMDFESKYSREPAVVWDPTTEKYSCDLTDEPSLYHQGLYQKTARNYQVQWVAWRTCAEFQVQQAVASAQAKGQSVNVPVAVRSNTGIETMANHVCKHVPAGYAVVLNMERGAATVELTAYGRGKLPLRDSTDLTLVEQMDFAIQTALSFQESPPITGAK